MTSSLLSSSAAAPAGRKGGESLILGGGTVHENDVIFYYSPTRGWDRGTFRGFGKPPAAGAPKLVHHSGTHSGAKDPTNNTNGRPILVRNKEGESYELAPRDIYIPLADTLATHAPHDLLALPELHHSVLVHAIRERHSRDVCYTFLGSLLCYLNPFQFNVPHYSMSMIDQYLSKAPHSNVHEPSIGGEHLLPHPWSVAHRVFHEMRMNRKNHSIIISGESGSGKTEACKIVLHYLCCLSADLIGVERPPHPQQAQAMALMKTALPATMKAAEAAHHQHHGGKQAATTESLAATVSDGKHHHHHQTKNNIAKLIDKVNASNPIMEAFGNAKTSRNDNSSRFGKLLEVQFSSSGEIGGMKISPFLLEKSRCVTAAHEERVYHSFYQLMAGATDQMKSELKLKNARDFPMLSRGGSIQVSGVNDAKEFEITCDAFSKMGFTKEEHSFVWKIVAACLHLSTVAFIAKLEPAAAASAAAATSGAANKPTPGAARAAAAMFETKVAAASASASASSSAAAPIRSSTAREIVKDDPASQQLAAISPVSVGVVEFVAQLLSVDPKDFSEMLVTRILMMGKDSMPKPLTILEAYRQRDTLQKHIYSCLFYWIIDKVNAATTTTTASSLSTDGGDPFVPANTISVLDIFGFEDFASGNSLEQLCINLANEALQRHYSYHVFIRDTEEISSEGVDAQMAPFCDNKPCVDLIMGSRGSLFAILEDHTAVDLDSGRVDPNQKYLEKITQKHKPDYHSSKPDASKSVMDRDPSELTQPSDFFARSRLDKDAFNVKHFASSVKYNVEGFCEKNIDSLKDHAKQVLFSSSDPLVQSLMELGAGVMQEGGGSSGGGDGGSPLTSPRGRGFAAASSSSAPLGSPVVSAATAAAAAPGKPTNKMGIVGQFRRSLQELLQTLDNTMPSWIRCIRPHPKKAPKLFDTKSVLEQLMATGVLETITQRQRNFPFRLEIPNFVHRFGAICAGSSAFKRIGRSGGLHEKCGAILQAASSTNRQHAQVGRTKVFLRTEVLNKLELKRQERVEVLASSVGVFVSASISARVHKQLQTSAAQRRIRRWYRRWRWFRRTMRALIAYVRKRIVERDEKKRQLLMEVEMKDRAVLATLEKTDRRPYHGKHMQGLLPLLQAATAHLVKVEPSFRDSRISKVEFVARNALVQQEAVARKAAAHATLQREQEERLAFERAMETLAAEVNEARREIRAEEKAERETNLELYWAPIQRNVLRLAERIKLFSQHRDAMISQLKEDYESERHRIKEGEERRIASEARLWQTLNGAAAIKKDMEELLAMGLTPEQAEAQMRRFFLSGAPSKMLASGALSKRKPLLPADTAAAATSTAATSHGTDAARVTHQNYADLLREQFEQSLKMGRTRLLPAQDKVEAAKEAILTQQQQQPRPTVSIGAASAGLSTSRPTTTTTTTSSLLLAAAPSYLGGSRSSPSSSSSYYSQPTVSDTTKMYSTFVRAMRDGHIPQGTGFNDYLEMEKKMLSEEQQRNPHHHHRHVDAAGVLVVQGKGGVVDSLTKPRVGFGGAANATTAASSSSATASSGSGYVCRRI